MIEVKIYVQNPKSTLASFMQDGRLALDLPIDFELSETFSPNKISVLGQIDDDFAVSSSFDATPRNVAIFTTYTREGIPILVLSGSRVLPYHYMNETQISEASDKIDVQLSSNNPFRLLKDVMLCDLDLGNFNYTEGGVLAHWQNDVANLAVPFYHPICSYGKWTDTSTGLIDVKFKDLRVWFREVSILQKMFCKISWQFSSDIYEVDFAKRIGSYLNGDTKNDRALLDKFSARFGFATEQAFSNSVSNFLNPVISKTENVSHSFTGRYGDFTVSVQFKDFGVNANGYYNTATRQITGLSGNYTLIADFFIKAGANLDGRLVVSVLKNGASFSGFYDCFGFFQNDFTPTHIEIPILNALPTDVYEIRYSGASTLNSSTMPYEIVISKASFLMLRADEVWISEGLNEAVAKYIDPTYTALEYLKGVIHAFNARLTILQETKTVTLQTPEAIQDIFKTGDDITGYYSQSQVDLRAVQVRDSEVIKNLDNETQLRRLEIGYKSASEYDFKKDFGVSFTEGVTENRNPFFDSTPVNSAHVARLSNVPQFPIADFSDLDNLNTLQMKISPRRAIFQNQRPAGVAVGANIFKFQGADRSVMPVCYTDGGGLLWGDTVRLESISYKNWAYLVYQKEIKNGAKQESFEALYWIQKHQLHTLDFRKCYIINFSNRVILARLIQISDFKNVQNLMTPLSFEPIYIDYEC